MDSAKTRILNITPNDAGAVRDDAMLSAVRDAAAGVYDLLGELGRNRRGSIVYLGRELATGNLIALKLDESQTEPGALELSVAAELDESIPALGYECQYCGQELDSWGRFCTACGRDVSGVVTSETSIEEREELLLAVRSASAGEYDILGEMPRTRGGGIVYFAREWATGLIVALRLQRDAESLHSSGTEYSLGKTQVLKPLVQGLDDVATTDPGIRPVDNTHASGRGLPRVEQDAAVIAQGGHVTEPAPEPAPPLPAPVDEPRSRVKYLVGGGIAAAALVAILAVALASVDDSPPPPIVKQEPPPPPPEPQLPPEPAPPPVVVPDSGELVIVRLPRGAEVRIDGVRLRGSTIKLPTGDYTIQGTAPGYLPSTQKVTVGLGRTTYGLRWVQQPQSPSTQTVKDSPPPEPPKPTCATTTAAKDWSSARQLCATEGEQGNAEAARRMGMMYLRGDGGAINEADALGWLQRAASRDDREAQYELGRLFQSSPRYRNEGQALHFLTRAADAGHAAAQFQVARMHEKGTATPKNLGEALRWFRRAAEQGHAGAQAGLGIFYMKGQGTGRDDVQAVEWLRKGAENGSADAMYYLGVLYSEGRGGLAKSPSNAREWYSRAAALGNPEARRALGRR